MAENPNLGPKVRSLRRRESLTQVRLAERLGISASYLNLIEHGKRPLTAALLLKLAQEFDLDLATFASDDDSRLTSDLMEIFGDPMFDGEGLTNTEVKALARDQPAIAQAVVHLYGRFTEVRGRARTLAERVVGDDVPDRETRLPTEEVTEQISAFGNYFPELEAAAEALWLEARLEPTDLWSGLVRVLERKLDVRVRIVSDLGRSLRRYDAGRRELLLSELLPIRSRVFQLAHQIGLLTQDFGERLAAPGLTTEDSRKLMRMVLASYFGGALLMPYEPFLAAATDLRYDIDRLGHRFHTSFEQVAHRLTTLQRPGAAGIPFHFVKIDAAGNISKRYGGSGIRFARFGGLCPRWNVTRGFGHGGIRTQISQMPSGKTYFCMARTVVRSLGGWGSPETVHAVGLGCDIAHAPQLVYADGIDLSSLQERVVPIGITCRLCERQDCDQRAFPSLNTPLQLDENVRGRGFYTSL